MDRADIARQGAKPAAASRPLSELARLFLKLGFTALGGPAAHIAMMKAEVVRRCEWLTEEEFLDLLGAANLIPGPNSTEMAIHIGFVRGGWAGRGSAGSLFRTSFHPFYLIHPLIRPYARLLGLLAPVRLSDLRPAQHAELGAADASHGIASFVVRAP